MHHYIVTDHEGQEEVALIKPLENEEISYMRKEVIPRMKPLSKEDYLYGPAAILAAEPAFCYVLDGKHVYWCIEWDPGLLVIRFDDKGKMAYASLQALNPLFGNRTATLKEIQDYEDQGRDQQVELVYQGYNAQFEDADRTGWTIAARPFRRTFDTAIEFVNVMHDQLEDGFGDDEAKVKAWQVRCEASPIWIGSPSV
jgi:hypothetical protein